MKRILLLTVAFTAFYVTQSPFAVGQTFFDYALGEVSNTPSTSVVRRVDEQKAIAAYWDGTYYRLAYVEPMDVISAKIDDHHAITDIRIVGDDIFFCGMDRSNYQAFLGHATVTGIESMTPHIEIMNFKVDYTTITRLWRLVAYMDPSGTTTHLVAVGDFWYTNDGVNPPPSGVPSCSPSGTCQSTLAVEYTYTSGIFTLVDRRVFHDITGHYEYACDVVELRICLRRGGD